MGKQTAVIIERQFIDDEGKVVVFRQPEWKVACWDAIEALPEIILGHSKCGAVKATLEAKGNPEGNIGAIVKKIMPAADAAKKKGGTPDEILEMAIKENAKNVYADVMKNGKIIPHLVQEGKFTIVAGEYDITTGKVET